jgi:Asp-tRNA(Asn)/Glu-tRNA(Gln) amidotransferase B subunit
LLTVVANRTTIKSLSERKLLIMADAKEIEETALIDRNMDQVFDWAKGNEMPIRDAIWDHEMEANGRDTMKTEAAVEWILKADDDKVKDYCEKNLKK